MRRKGSRKAKEDRRNRRKIKRRKPKDKLRLAKHILTCYHNKDLKLAAMRYLDD